MAFQSTYVGADELQGLVRELAGPLAAARATRGNLLREQVRRAAGPPGGPAGMSDGGNGAPDAEDDGTDALINAVTQAALQGYFHDRRTRQEHALDMEKFREAQRLTGLREERDYQRGRTDRLEDYGRARADQQADLAAARDFQREERQAAVADRNAAARENDERDARNRPNAVMSKFAEARLAEGDLAGAARLGIPVPGEAPEMRQAATELAQQAAAGARESYEEMARQLVRDLPPGAPLGPLGQKMQALQQGVQRRFSGDPQAGRQLAAVIQRAVESEIETRRAAGWRAGHELPLRHVVIGPDNQILRARVGGGDMSVDEFVSTLGFPAPRELPAGYRVETRRG